MTTSGMHLGSGTVGPIANIPLAHKVSAVAATTETDTCCLLQGVQRNLEKACGPRDESAVALDRQFGERWSKEACNAYEAVRTMNLQCSCPKHTCKERQPSGTLQRIDVKHDTSAYPGMFPC